jgi:hypothetical protein
MNMGEPVYVDKTKVITQLRSRQLHARADWVPGERDGAALAMVSWRAAVRVLGAGRLPCSDSEA